MQATMWRCPSNNHRNIRRCVAGVVFIPVHSYHTIDYIRHSVCPVLLSLCVYTPRSLVWLPTVFSAMPRQVLFPCAICEKSTKCKKSSIECAQCGLWVHAACASLSDADISRYRSSDQIFMCRCCVLVEDAVCHERLLSK